jgi:hypothetical protein
MPPDPLHAVDEKGDLPAGDVMGREAHAPRLGQRVAYLGLRTRRVRLHRIEKRRSRCRRVAGSCRSFRVPRRRCANTDT